MANKQKKILNPKKCCFCLPLTKGLLCIGYIRLIICLASIIQFTVVSVNMFQGMVDNYEDAVIFLKAVASIVPQLLDTIFSLTFIIAIHKKSVKLVEVYYSYCVTMVLVYLLVVVLLSCDQARFSILYSIMFMFSWYIQSGCYLYIGLGVVLIMFHTYLTVLVRSEMHRLKMRNQAELVRQRSSISFRLPALNRRKL